MTIAGRPGEGEYTASVSAQMRPVSWRVAAVGRIVIIGGGPGGYEAALVAAQLDADVTLVEADGAGGACVLSDCVPSKTFIASSDVVTGYCNNERFGVSGPGLGAVTAGAAGVNT